MHLLKLFVRSFGKSAFVSSLIDGISKLINDWLPEVKINTKIPCIHCLLKDDEKPTSWGCFFLFFYF